MSRKSAEKVANIQLVKEGQNELYKCNLCRYHGNGYHCSGWNLSTLYRVRRYGQACQMSANGITLNGCVYYDTAVTATITGTVAGAVTLAVYQDGVAVPGMTATQTVKAVGDAVTLGVSGIVRVVPSRSKSTLTVVISGQPVTGTNLAIDITKQ